MKLKGVNPFERHIEKIVLGLVLVILLGVIAMQFVTQPNAVKDGGRTITPDQVYMALAPQANQLQSQLTDQNPGLPAVESVDLVARYNQAFDSAGAGREQLSSALGRGVNVASLVGGSVIDIPAGGTQGPVEALAVPATTRPVAASQWATLDPYAVVEVPAYAEYVPAQQPFDFPSITVEASFNGKDLERVLNGEGEGGGKAIPRRFWSATGLAIMGFEAQRQRLMPDGSWGEATPIETPPGTPIPARAIGANAGLQDLTTLVTNASRASDEVARPMFPPTIAGTAWEPPSERVVAADESESAQLRRVQRQLDRARAELERLTNTQQPGPRTDPRGPGGGGKTSVRDDRNQPRTTPRTNPDRVTQVRDRIKSLEDQLKALGADSDDTASGRGARARSDEPRSVLEEEAVQLWAHDLGVEPGATYRYRTRVVVNNPLFRKGTELDPDDADQQALTQNPFARGAWSEWSEPVVAGAREYFFVTGADLGANQGSANQGSDSPKATIELYEMYYGHYRKSTLSVSPGDELATTVRISGKLLSFDTATLKAGDAAKAVEALGAEDQSSALPAGISELANRVTIDLGVYMLDVYAGQGEHETDLGQKFTPMRVVLRDAQGHVVVRSDLADESSLAYQLASASAAAASETPLRAPGVEPAISPSAALFAPVVP